MSEERGIPGPVRPDVDLTRTYEYRPMFPKVEGEELIDLTVTGASGLSQSGGDGEGSLVSPGLDRVGMGISFLPRANLGTAVGGLVPAEGWARYMIHAAIPWISVPDDWSWISDYLRQIETKARTYFGRAKRHTEFAFAFVDAYRKEIEEAPPGPDDIGNLAVQIVDALMKGAKALKDKLTSLFTSRFANLVFVIFKGHTAVGIFQDEHDNFLNESEAMAESAIKEKLGLSAVDAAAAAKRLRDGGFLQGVWAKIGSELIEANLRKRFGLPPR